MSQTVFSLLKACLFFFSKCKFMFHMPQIWNNVQESLHLLFCQFHCLFWLSIQLSVPFVYLTVYSICQIIKTTLCKIDIFSDIAKTIRIQKLWSIKLSIQICSKFVYLNGNSYIKDMICYQWIIQPNIVKLDIQSHCTD